MLDVLTLTFVVAQSGLQTPAPTPDWSPAPLQKGEYRRFTRRAANGPDEFLVGATQLCDCQPEHIVDDLVTVFGNVPSASVVRSVAPVCGTQAQHVLVTGVADSVSRRNIDIYAFRAGGSLVVISYLFSKATPSPEDDASMLALCPSKTDTARTLNG